MRYQMDGAHRGVMILDGELTIQQAGRLRDALKAAWEEVEHLELRIDGVQEVDMAGLQVLCSAHRTFLKSGRRLTIESRLPSLVEKALADTGLREKQGCAQRCDGICLFAFGGAL